MEPDAPTQPNPWTWAIGLGWLLPLFGFMMAHNAINQPEPDVGTGFALYMLAFLLGAGLVAVAIAYRGELPWWPFIAAGVLAVPGVIYTAWPAQDLYGAFGFPFWAVYFWGPFVAIGYSLTVIIAAIAKGRTAAIHATWLWGLALAATWAGAALYHLATIQHQAQLAREAHEAPALGLVAATVAVGWLARQSR